MKLKGKQLSRVRLYRSADPFNRKIARLRHSVDKMIKKPVEKVLWAHFDIKKQMSQLLPAAIDKDAWYNDFDAMALCQLFGVPYEVYQASQVNKSL
jgi:hypothetical protein